MRHKCVNCGKIYEHASEEIIRGCPCGSRLFYFVKSAGKKKDIKEDADIEYFYEMEYEEAQEIIVFDIETINIKSDGKYELNIEGLMNHGKKYDSGMIYKYGEGKYSIDLEDSMKRVKWKR
ncbi:MAG: OapC/ArvC family zinc-ribbon domain-containing protein [Candidatus Woesearchaeota archaeon]